MPNNNKSLSNHDPCNAGLECAGAGMLSTIDSRINMYTVAQTNASKAGESSKARRFGRALTTLNELKRNLKAGRSIREEDIPPALASSTISPTHTSTVPAIPSNTSHPTTEGDPSHPNAMDMAFKAESNKVPKDQELPSSESTENPKQEQTHLVPISTKSISKESQLIASVRSYREKYKVFALQSKSKGDKENAVWGLKAVKLCDMVLKKLEKGDSADFDISSLPELPSSDRNETKSDASSEQQIPAKLQRTFSRDDPIQIPDNPDDIPPPDRTAPVPKTVEEALNQRLSRYREDEAKAKAEGNASRTRRLGRICKQYEDALKLHKRGKPLPVAELPTPPGFPPIPVSNNVNVPSSSNQNSENVQSDGINSSETSTVKPPAMNSNISKPKTAVLKQKSLSVQEKQLALLEKRQAMFKSAALEAKRAGQIEQAKEYLRSSKGFDKLIEASKGGLPVDITTLPVPPQAITSKIFLDSIFKSLSRLII